MARDRVLDDLDFRHAVILSHLQRGDPSATDIADALDMGVDEVLTLCEQLQRAGLIIHVP
jgi:DNA-binding IclR family transcriptional regulator